MNLWRETMERLSSNPLSDKSITASVAQPKESSGATIGRRFTLKTRAPGNANATTQTFSEGLVGGSRSPDQTSMKAYQAAKGTLRMKPEASIDEPSFEDESQPSRERT